MTQDDVILRHLKDFGPLTPLDALRLYGCFRLGARIWDLKQAGHNIETSIVRENGKHFAKYTLIKEPAFA